ncbi:MAG TPA: protein kinase [Candidatus Eisenbacteria bacterium]|nr:protein kinase [Candidatus Eisenbacteria bacterium]
MAIAPGTRLGPYEIVGRVGEGGMGVVYRARDDRLGRDVAVKVIPPELASDKERLRRFQIEARAAGQLNHPNIVIIHDLGTSDGAPYIVSEMLEGETLRPSLSRGPLPARRAVALAVQIAHGLASAHAAGIVHRDLKPENLFLNRSGVLKILDFGIAKLFQSDGAAGEETASVLPGLTRTGTILGTASYMAPEQIREQAIDQRTDLFAFGAILYEMLTGEKAFPGATPADRMSAILNRDTPPLPREVESEAPGIGRVVSRCLEKLPEHRFQTASDLGFALELLEELEPSAATPSQPVAAAAPAIQFPRFERVTYREGNVRTARFAPDGQSVIYGAALEGTPLRLYWSYPGSPEARALGVPGSDLMSVCAATSELAVCLRTVFLGGFVSAGTLARMPLGGGAARELVDNVVEADWGPDGRNLSVIREKQGMIRLEYPVGRVLYQTPGWASHARIAPDGKSIAFIDHPFRGDDAGRVAVVDMEGNVRQLVGDFASTRGLAWTPKGDEIWFSGAKVGADRVVHAVRTDGATRQVFSAPGASDVQDISRSGTLLIAQGDERLRMEYRNRAGDVMRDLTWLDWSLVRDLSPDARTVLFDETGAGGGSGQSVYMRDVDGSPAVRLGDGSAVQFSPDGRWALALQLQNIRPVLLPTGVGEPRPIETEGLVVRWGAWHPDGKSLLVTGNEPGHGSGLYRVDIETARWTRIGDRELSGFQEVRVSPDGSRVVAQGADGEFTIFPMDGSEPRSLPGIPGRARIIGWTRDGGALLYMIRGEVPAPTIRIDIETGEKTHWADLAPRSLAGVVTLTRIVMTPDAEHFVYSYPRFLTNLYKVEGLL